MKKALVCYVTPVDATADIAMTVAQQLCRLGLHVELRPVARARSPRHYRSIIIGGAVDSDRWDPDALSYLGDCHTDDQYSVWPFHTDFGCAPTSMDLRPGESSGCPSLPQHVRHLAGPLGAGPVPIFRASRDCDATIRRWATGIGEDVTLGRLLDGTDSPREASLLSVAGW